MAHHSRKREDATGPSSSSRPSSSSHSSERDYKSRMRERKHKKLYSDDWALADDDIEGRRTFNLYEKLEDPAFASDSIVKEMKGKDLTVEYFQRYGFNTPLLISEKAGLGLSVPTSNFTINDVRMCVGSKRILDVMDVNTQKNSEMTMKEWQKYYEDKEKDKLLNVISLEFSHTKLEHYVESPSVVRQVDWVDNVWPRHLKQSQIEGTNVIDEMKYPKVQKYCLMSVKGCYTDFHVDFGGTSVWYHILKGSKVFWLIPPTEQNLSLYEKWVLSGKQSDIFFGDKVDKCVRITLQEGNTFFIPTGWIHAVYTPKDSLVFGGNFLHSYGIEKQLKIAQVEDNTKVPQKFRYPFFTEMLWYVLERYVHCLLGHSHLSTGTDITIPPDKPRIHMTHMELHGLKAIVLYLHMLPANRKNVPELVKDPVALIQDVRNLIGIHRLDMAELAISGKPILWVQINENDQEKKKSPIRAIKHNNGTGIIKPPKMKRSANGDKGGPRRRRTRCKKCEACQRADCGECSFCLDMVKFGGPGRAKQTCNMRQCLQPMLPVTAACVHCGLDGWNQTPVTPLQKGPQRCESASNLMECSVCYEITHPHCMQKMCSEFSGYVNEDLPNSWECPMCCKLGKNTDYRPRHFRARQKSTDMRRMSISSDASSAFDNSKTHNSEQLSDSGGSESGDLKYSRELLPIKKRRGSDGEVEVKPKPTLTDHLPRKTAFRNQLAQQIINNTTRTLKKPIVVVRPAALIQNPVPINNLALDKRCMLKVFRYLKPSELFTCSLVCKTWASYTVDPSLWKKMEFSRKHITSDMLKGIVRRQPETLHLDWCHLSKFQLPWLFQRLSCLKSLSLISVNVKTAVSLKTNHSAVLQDLDLSFVSDFNDSALRDILGPNHDNRRGMGGEDRYRFKNLKVLKLAGTDISDVSMRYVTQYLPNLRELSLAFCPRITDAGIAQLSTKPAATVTNLVTLDLSHSKLITETSLEHLSRCENLTRLDCRHSLQVSTQSLIKFAAKSDHDLHVKDIKLVEKRQVTRRI